MIEKKRALMIINSDLINAGVPNVVMTIVRQLSSRFIFDIVTYHNQEGQYDAEIESFGGKIFNLSLLDYGKHKILYPFRCVQIKRFLKRILSQNKYDIIHCHNGIEAGIFLKYAKFKGIPVRIAHAHGTYHRKGNNKILLWYNSHCKKLIRRHVTTALACSTQAGESLFISNDFINILNPVAISSYLNLDKRVHDGCHLLQIGYFCANKNQLFSIRLLKSLLDENMNAKLTFIGFVQDEAYFSEMQKTIEELSLKENVCFLPPNADKAEVFADTDIVLLPSFSEGLPLVALESQAAHVFTLLSDHVTTDANLGLAYYAEHNNLTKWKDIIKQLGMQNYRSDNVNIDTQSVEISGWCNKIEAIYDEN